MTPSTPRELLEAVGRGLDSDIENKVHGRAGTDRIPFLHKKPTSYREAAIAMYEMLRASGITFVVEYDPDDIDFEMLAAANAIRLEAQGEERSTMHGPH